MEIHRSPRDGGRFTIIPNETLRDPRLSYLARGVLAEVLSRPDDWQTNADTLAARARKERGKAGEGRRAMRAAFAELAAAGYLHREKFRDASGHVVTRLHVFDCPQTDVPDGGTSVPPGQTSIPAGRTDVPPTGVPVTGTPVTGTPVGGTSLRRPATETETKTDHEDGSLKTPGAGGAGKPAPSQSLRDHDGPEPDGPDDQHFSIEVHAGAQPQAVTRASTSASEPPGDPEGDISDDEESRRQRLHDALTEWQRQNEPAATP